ncbi:hypothetical protein WME95_21760 [Sorangium sp. So ce327]
MQRSHDRLLVACGRPRFTAASRRLAPPGIAAFIGERTSFS